MALMRNLPQQLLVLKGHATGAFNRTCRLRCCPCNGKTAVHMPGRWSFAATTPALLKLLRLACRLRAWHQHPCLQRALCNYPGANMALLLSGRPWQQQAATAAADSNSSSTVSQTAQFMGALAWFTSCLGSMFGKLWCLCVPCLCKQHTKGLSCATGQLTHAKDNCHTSKCESRIGKRN